MKRMFVFLILLFVVCFLFKTQTKLFDFYNAHLGQCSLYLNQKVSINADCNYSVIENAQGIIVKFSSSDRNKISVNKKTVLGESVEFCRTNTSLKELLNEIGFIEYYKQDFGSFVSFYGRSLLGEKNIFIDGKLINTQVVFDADKIILGFPVVLGSY